VRPVVVAGHVGADHLPGLVEGLELVPPDAALLELAEPGLDERLALGVAVAATAVSSPDYGSAYRWAVHALACRAMGIRQLRTRVYRPQTNGKAEHFIRTMLAGWAYGAIPATARNAPQPLTAGYGHTTIAADTQPSAATTDHAAEQPARVLHLGLVRLHSLLGV
jgi:hypothetical protein